MVAPPSWHVSSRGAPPFWLHVLSAHHCCSSLLSCWSWTQPSLEDGGMVLEPRGGHMGYSRLLGYCGPQTELGNMCVCVHARVRLCVGVCVESYTPMSAHTCIFLSKLGSLSSHPLFQSNSTGFIPAPLSGVCTMRNPGDGRGWHSAWGTALPRFPEAGAHT